jgi:hypothetical protein
VLDEVMIRIARKREWIELKGVYVRELQDLELRGDCRKMLCIERH